MASSLSPAPTPEALSLPTEINVATRHLHTRLNRLITTRLPLALPPHTSTPHLYAFGLRHFAQVYSIFESLWRDLAPAPGHAPSPPGPICITPPPTPFPPPDPRVLAFLSTLRPPGLARSQRLRKDLDALCNALLPVDLELAAELSGPPAGEQLHEYCVHMREAVSARPHVLVAYAWVMYMAVFSGGRWIRGQLVGAGEGFWRGIRYGHRDSGEEEKEERGLEQVGLSFWHFVGEGDGEDIKREFKRRLAEAETVFTEKERWEVVEEAVEIFRRSLLLVEELDELLGSHAQGLVETDKMSAARHGAAAHQMVVRKPRTWFSKSGFAGLAVLLSFVSWFAVSHCSVTVLGKKEWDDFS
ncbi:hypothetical protein W97_03178 [Coniosporium apollinis CBS 100218]|uniref:Heme oxygenase-like protein n=1 Tax=Coniosporium apollinis (strain CBS 100218) TaxID=1168221 RepID=R7YQ52_CONA1|nr:uncharacterized protein W97_03178 [Coniosporium apollinis CBS 100218]EON63949.1 hypothetical protein W97_03178 [Coniosporium apollinis CBS 100218]